MFLNLLAGVLGALRISPRRLRGLWSKRSASVKAYKPSTRYVPLRPVCRMWSALHPSPTAPPGTICWCSAGTGTFRRCLDGARSLRCSAQDRLDSGHPCCCFGEDLASSAACLPRRLVQYANISSISSISAISVSWPALDARCQQTCKGTSMQYLLPLPAEYVHVGTRLVSQACVE